MAKALKMGVVTGWAHAATHMAQGRLTCDSWRCGTYGRGKGSLLGQELEGWVLRGYVGETERNWFREASTKVHQGRDWDVAAGAAVWP